MSRIGEESIVLPPEVKINIEKGRIQIVGKEGEMRLDLPTSLKLELVNDKLLLKRSKDDKKTKSIHGLFRNLIANAIFGVQKQWEKRLEVVGTGYNVKLKGEDLELKVGFSHPVLFKAVPGVKFIVEGDNKITIRSVDKQLAGQIAYQIKSIKKPDVYKGKGIKYEGEQLRLKPGKKAKTTEEV